MKARVYKLAWAAAVIGIGGLGITLICSAAGMRINTSRSIPLGFYWTSAHPVEKGAYVFLCPPETSVMAQARRRGYLHGGLCPGLYGNLMKKVVAMAEDEIVISDQGVSVNGVLLPLSAPLAYDRSGRRLQRFEPSRFTVGSAELLLMSDVSATSFDSRYFGPIDRAQVKTVIVPVLTW